MAWIKYVCLILLATLTFNAADAASSRIYVWKNEKGQLVYSDSPQPGAEEVDVKSTNTISTPNVDTSILDLKPKEIKESYSVSIVSPTDKGTVRDNTGSVYIAGAVSPIFKKGLMIQLLLDGSPYGGPQDHSRFALRNVDRGEHQIKLNLLNEKGKVIASSEPITFYMHRASVIKAK